MDPEELLTHLKTLEDIQLLYRIEEEAKRRRNEIQHAEIKAKTELAWNRVKELVRGEVLYVCNQGTFLGGPLQRGDSVMVLTVQKRKRVLWTKLLTRGDGRTEHKTAESIGFSPMEVFRYDLREEPPDKPISEYERKLAEGLFGR